MLTYDMPVYRPPSEGDNLIIQATLGCSFNRCTFCSMYKTKRYRARPLETVFRDIDAAARAWPTAHRVFLADGDALTLPTEMLLALLTKLANNLPDLQRVSCYATPINLTQKSEAELRQLRDAGLKLIYVGIESGSDLILKRIRKGAIQETMVCALEQARAAGLKVSATVILGLGGRHLWTDHIDGTAALVNRAAPTFLSTLQLTLMPDEEADFIRQFERFDTPFEPQDDAGVLAEQARLLSSLTPPRPVIFRSNHASNCLPLAGTLPKDRDHLLALLSAAQSGAPLLRPTFMRGL